MLSCGALSRYTAAPEDRVEQLTLDELGDLLGGQRKVRVVVVVLLHEHAKRDERT